MADSRETGSIGPQGSDDDEQYQYWPTFNGSRTPEDETRRPLVRFDVDEFGRARRNRGEIAPLLLPTRTREHRPQRHLRSPAPPPLRRARQLQDMIAEEQGTGADAAPTSAPRRLTLSERVPSRRGSDDDDEEEEDYPVGSASEGDGSRSTPPITRVVMREVTPRRSPSQPQADASPSTHRGQKKDKHRAERPKGESSSSAKGKKENRGGDASK